MVNVDPYTTFRLNLLNGKVPFVEGEKHGLFCIMGSWLCHDKKEWNKTHWQVIPVDQNICTLNVFNIKRTMNLKITIEHVTRIKIQFSHVRT